MSQTKEPVMSETRRGSPTEDGMYLIQYVDGVETVVRKEGDSLHGVAGIKYSPHGIKCHRPHTPLVVPELKKLHKHSGKPRVVRFYDEVCYAEHWPIGGHSDWIVIVHTKTGVYWTGKGTAPDITRAQCEAAGFEWPSECEEPKR